MSRPIDNHLRSSDTTDLLHLLSQQQPQPSLPSAQFIQQAQRDIQQRSLQTSSSSPKPASGSRSSTSPPLRSRASFRVDEGYSEDMQVVPEDVIDGRRRFQFAGDRLILPDWMMALDESIREGNLTNIPRSQKPSPQSSKKLFPAQ